MHSFTFVLAGFVAAASAQGYGAPTCDDVYNDCIASYTNKGEAPFFPECASKKAACEGGVSASVDVPTPTPTPSAGKCTDVYNQCIASYTSKGEAPFFPECASQQAACEAGVSASVDVPTPTPTPSADKCDDVYNECIASYTNKGEAPFFPECNSRRAACQASTSAPAPAPTQSAPVTPETCDQVYNDCINSYTSKGEAPFFPECNSRKAACLAQCSSAPAPTPSSPAAPSAPVDKCQQVYNDCINSYTSKGQAPFFPECNSRRAECEGSVHNPAPTPSSPAAPSASSPSAPVDKCQQVYNDCINSYTSKGQAPFFPECNSRRAECEGSVHNPAPTPSSPAAPSASSPSAPVDKCQQVYNDCINSYTSKGQAPFFPECNSRRAECEGSVHNPAPSGTVPTPVRPTPPAFTGAAVKMDVSAVLGLFGVVAAAVL